MTIACALGLALVLLFVARAIVKRRADTLDIGFAPAMVTIAPAPSTSTADAVVVHLDAYRYRRARAAGYHHESHSAS